MGLLALLVTLVTAKTRNGIGVLVILVSIAYYVTQRMGGAITYWNDAAPVGQNAAILILQSYHTAIVYSVQCSRSIYAMDALWYYCGHSFMCHHRSRNYALLQERGFGR